MSKTLGTSRHRALIAFPTAKRHTAVMSQSDLADTLGEYQSSFARISTDLEPVADNRENEHQTIRSKA